MLATAGTADPEALVANKVTQCEPGEPQDEPGTLIQPLLLHTPDAGDPPSSWREQTRVGSAAGVTLQLIRNEES